MTTIDVIFAMRGAVSKIYLLDAVVEAVIVLAWIFAYMLR